VSKWEAATTPQRPRRVLLQSAGAQHPAWHCASKHPQRSHSVGAINRPSTLPRLRGRKQRKVSGGTHAVAVVGELAGERQIMLHPKTERGAALDAGSSLQQHLNKPLTHSRSWVISTIDQSHVFKFLSKRSSLC